MPAANEFVFMLHSLAALTISTNVLFIKLLELKKIAASPTSHCDYTDYTTVIDSAE